MSFREGWKDRVEGRSFHAGAVSAGEAQAMRDHIMKLLNRAAGT